jgi:DNA polymerase III delta prime subunit
MNNKHALWFERYRPQSLKDYIFHDKSQQTSIKRMIREKSIPHLLLSGIQGSGKSTLSYILVNELKIDDVDVLTINASDENSIDVMREKIKSFVMTFAMGDFKVIQLEEADYISPNGQAMLRHLMEQYADTARFILTCNYENKIIPAIKSRVQHFKFVKHNINQVTEYIAKILLKEKVSFNLDDVDNFVRVGYPDIRKIINLVQQYTTDGKLSQFNGDEELGDYKFKLLDLIENDSWNEARSLLSSSITDDEWIDLYRFLYDNLNKSSKFSNENKWQEGILAIADHLYRDSIVSDREINAAAMLIKLSTI